jgi:DNA-binding NarL/FixJ family response regulator
VAAPAGLDQLTPRQVEVLRLVARGMTNAEIAETLFLSRRTVHAHLRAIFHKLAVGNRSAATRYAIQAGLL